MADSLFGLLTLDYARLMMNRDDQDDESFEKKRKALSLLAQDVVRLRRTHLHARRVQIQETRLENEQEKTEEQLQLKFTEWADNPEVRKALVLAPMERDRQMRILSDLPPAPEDALVERETRNDVYFGRSSETNTKITPGHTTKSNRSGTAVPPVSGKKPQSSGTTVPPVSDPKSDTPPPPASEKVSKSNDHSSRPIAPPSPSLSSEAVPRRMDGREAGVRENQTTALSPLHRKPTTIRPLVPSVPFRPILTPAKPPRNSSPKPKTTTPAKKPPALTGRNKMKRVR